ncbi:hypothetical protein HJC23_013271 [Cyclotella cryptica]|uniref:DUF6824 domain-containing protein n=1 Tax=Cyclotella cryptica TaxID=29204 RepID=A0ABD3PI02_9STRA
MYSILIYDEIRSMNPPGRFLKQDPNTKLWSDIGKKKALDKTRQALREGAPEMLKELGDDGGAGGDESNDEDEDQDNGHAAKFNTNARDNNALNASFMSNLSIGSFSLEDPLNDSFRSLQSLQSALNQGNGGNFPGVGAGSSMHNDQGPEPNRMLIAAQMKLIEQQMAQWQQLINLQNLLQNSGNQIDPNTHLQLLNLQMQLQNQLQQNQQHHQNVPGFPSFPAPQANPHQQLNPNGNTPQFQLNDQNLSALLSALHGNAANPNNPPNQSPGVAGGPANPNNAFQQFQQQLALQQLQQKINSNNSQGINGPTPNSNNWGANPNNIDHILNAASAINGTNYNQMSGFGDFTVPLNDGSSSHDQIVGRSMPMKNNERTPGNTSYARAQRIGLKNSFTRRPNAHRPGELANSLMSLDSLNLDDIEEMSESHRDEM